MISKNGRNSRIRKGDPIMSKPISQKDIKRILKLGQGLDKIGLKYGIKGSLTKIFIEAYNQLKGDEK